MRFIKAPGWKSKNLPQFRRRSYSSNSHERLYYPTCTKPVLDSLPPLLSSLTHPPRNPSPRQPPLPSRPPITPALLPPLPFPNKTASLSHPAPTFCSIHPSISPPSPPPPLPPYLPPPSLSRFPSTPPPSHPTPIPSPSIHSSAFHDPIFPPILLTLSPPPQPSSTLTPSPLLPYPPYLTSTNPTP